MYPDIVVREVHVTSSSVSDSSALYSSPSWPSLSRCWYSAARLSPPRRPYHLLSWSNPLARVPSSPPPAHREGNKTNFPCLGIRSLDTRPVLWSAYTSRNRITLPLYRSWVRAFHPQRGPMLGQNHKGGRHNVRHPPACTGSHFPGRSAGCCAHTHHCRSV